jgi:hypothetical protein
LSHDDVQADWTAVKGGSSGEVANFSYLAEDSTALPPMDPPRVGAAACLVAGNGVVS